MTTAPRRNLWRLVALVAGGAVLLAVAFPLVSWWLMERRLARVFALQTRVEARVVPRPVPNGSVEEAFACAMAVLVPLPRDVPLLQRSWDDKDEDPLQPWLDGAEPLSTLPPEVAEALFELEPALVPLRSCAGARELARGRADLTGHNRKLQRIGRATTLFVTRALLEGRPSDAAQVCVETLAVFADSTYRYGSVGVTRRATFGLLPACIEALRRQPQAAREKLRAAWTSLPARLPSNEEVVEDRWIWTVPLSFRDLLSEEQRAKAELHWGTTRADLDLPTLRSRARELTRAERVFEDVLALASRPGRERTEACAAFDLLLSSMPGLEVDLDGELRALETTRSSLSVLSALATGAPLPEGVVLSERGLTISPDAGSRTLPIPPFAPR